MFFEHIFICFTIYSGSQNEKAACFGSILFNCLVNIKKILGFGQDLKNVTAQLVVGVGALLIVGFLEALFWV